jgi:hypothetical protein
VLFEWTGQGAAAPVGIGLSGEGKALRDSLRFDGSGRAELWLSPGRYRYEIDGGGTGMVVVDQWSEEWLPRPVLLSDRASPAAAAFGITSTRRWIWLFLLGIAGLIGEWLARKRLGLR